MKKADYLTHITDRRNRNLKFFSLIKRYCPCVLLVYVQVQLIPFILCIIQQNFTYTLRLHFTRNKNALNIFII